MNRDFSTFCHCVISGRKLRRKLHENSGLLVGSFCGQNQTIIDFLDPNRISAGLVCNPGTTLAKAEDHKSDKYTNLINDIYFNQ